MSVFKESSGFSFSRDLRLLTASEFQFVFDDAKRFGNRAFTVLARNNNLDHARIGLAISKKCAKKAVDRNRIKRAFRESFRLNHARLPAVDLIAMCKVGVLQLENHEIHQQINLQWNFICKSFIHCDKSIPENHHIKNFSVNTSSD